MFPTAPGLDQDLENVGVLLESERTNEDMEFTEFYSPTTGKLHARGKNYLIKFYGKRMQLLLTTSDNHRKLIKIVALFCNQNALFIFELDSREAYCQQFLFFSLHQLLHLLNDAVKRTYSKRLNDR